MRGCGQWGLLGGSSHPDKGGVGGKPSKLASLARSNRGAFGKRSSQQQKQGSGKLDSVLRLATLGSSSRTQELVPPDSTTPAIVQVEPITSQLNEEPRHILESKVEASTDPPVTQLWAQPSVLANSLFTLWVMPRDVANSLVRIYANPYLLTVSNEAHLKTAFSNPSPDDIVQNARLRSKGARHFQ